MTSISHDDIQMRQFEETGDSVPERSKNAEGTGTGHEIFSTEGEEETPDYPNGLKFWLIILPLRTLLAIGGLDTNIVATAVPTSITDDFYTVANFMFGKLYKLISIKRRTVLPKEDTSLGLSIVLPAQYFGPAVFVAIAQVIFMNKLAINFSNVVPGLNPETIESYGLFEIVGHTPPDKRKEVFARVGNSLTETWYLTVGLTCATMLSSLFMEWRSAKPKTD
ncbi:hypothetical protein BDV25DRAFT_137495 [Aspergillus avenaceus]|uniref:Uncharacterized protein n=1 Tax=Aspergillus avenaceus TaxID=36643 RepID=A0A5N6U317_ASPAV|nr:hypothetical protein BDV25DRAFT_137495 [Aspergillus avenaceus]